MLAGVIVALILVFEKEKKLQNRDAVKAPSTLRELSEVSYPLFGRIL